LIFILPLKIPTFVPMKIRIAEITLWKVFFWALVGGYCLYYAPYGVNETDGGFLTGLAWQVLQGKLLYQDVLYVRPPLPVWLRALELYCLPENYGILGERWIFYGKVGLYSWLGAAILYQGKARWILAVFGFVVSAHCYPAMAWHTVDGILFAVLAAYLFFTSGTGKFQWLSTALAGVSLLASMLCKQSFYPLLGFFLVAGCFSDKYKLMAFGGGFLAAFALFFSYLQQHAVLFNYLKMTNGAANSGQAFQHGFLDYFHINPALALPSLGLLLLAIHSEGRLGRRKLLSGIWVGWLLALVLSYVAVTWMRQEYTVPIAQTRALFWVAAWHVLTLWIRPNSRNAVESSLLLGITWCAAISWGYSIPILFATPWIWAVMELSQHTAFLQYARIFRWAMLAMLLLAFRVGFEFVYRDGNRSEMMTSLGAVFPKMTGIYTDEESVARYKELKQLAEKYGNHFAVMPAFPYAHYLTGATPPLPLDWVVNRETNGVNALVYKCLEVQKPYIFVEKSYREKWATDTELEVTRKMMETALLLEETPSFLVLRAP